MRTDTPDRVDPHAAPPTERVCTPDPEAVTATDRLVPSLVPCTTDPSRTASGRCAMDGWVRSIWYMVPAVTASVVEMVAPVGSVHAVPSQVAPLLPVHEASGGASSGPNTGSGWAATSSGAVSSGEAGIDSTGAAGVPATVICLVVPVSACCGICEVGIRPSTRSALAASASPRPTTCDCACVCALAAYDPAGCLPSSAPCNPATLAMECP